MSRFFLARVIIETCTPLAISTGGRETGFDTQLARDANGLPYIPATSVAGVWRSLVKRKSEALDAFWFGDTDRSSRLTVSDGVVLNSEGKPVQGLQTPEVLEQDALLKLLLQSRPHHRDRVRINDRGVAADEAKFDQLMLPAGVRFCIDVRGDDCLDNAGTAEDQSTLLGKWPELFSHWQDRMFTLGGTTRNGLGQIKVIGFKRWEVDLTQRDDAVRLLGDFMQRKEIPSSVEGLPEIRQMKPFATLRLQALDNWRFGRGTELFYPQHGKDRSVGIISYSERTIDWSQGEGKLSNKAKAVLCGSSVKGTLAHRTAFHLRRLSRCWAEDTDDSFNWEGRPGALDELFGYVDEDDQDKSVAGRLYVDDCEAEFEQDGKKSQSTLRTHNNIDRFTGGVMSGALYCEELLYRPSFNLKLWLAPGTTVDETVKKALLATLEDLQNGMLPLGGGSGRGVSLLESVPEHNFYLDDSQMQIKSPQDIKEVANES